MGDREEMLLAWPVVGGDASYEHEQALAERFPDEDVWDFCAAVRENGGPEAYNGRDWAVRSIVCEQHGENDGADWIWLVEFADGAKWHVEGGCDYTGWDCQSSIEWIRIL